MIRTFSSIASILILGALIIVLVVARPGPSSGAAGAATDLAGGSTAVPFAAPVTPPLVDDQPAAAADLAPGPDAEPPIGECAHHTGMYETVEPLTVTMLAGSSRAVIVGEIGEIGPARWNTPDGKAPAEDWEVGAARVIRLFTIINERSLRVDAGEVGPVGWVRGGAIGCHTFSIVGVPDLKVGARYVFVLGGNHPSVGKSTALEAIAIMPFDADGRVQTPNEGAMSPAELEAAVAKAPVR